MKLFYFYLIIDKLSLSDCAKLINLNQTTTSDISIISNNKKLNLDSILDLFSEHKNNLLLITLYGNDEDNRNCFYKIKNLLK